MPFPGTCIGNFIIVFEYNCKQMCFRVSSDQMFHNPDSIKTTLECVGKR